MKKLIAILLLALLTGCMTAAQREMIANPYPPPTWTSVAERPKAEKDKDIFECEQEKTKARPTFIGKGRDAPLTGKDVAAVHFLTPVEVENLLEDRMAEEVFERCMISKGWVKQVGPRKWP